MSDIEYESELSVSEHETVYTHFRPTNHSASSVELTCTIDDTATVQSQDDKESRCSKFKTRALKCSEVLLLFVVIFIIWSALSVPSVFFVLSQDGGSNISTSPQFANTCSEYTGEVCVGYLRSFKRCLPHTSTPISPVVVIPDSPNQAENKQALNELNIALSYLEQGFVSIDVSAECVSALKPFACLYFLGLCSDNTIIRPTRKQCVTIKATCKSLVDLVKSSNMGKKLPDCENLPSSTDPGPINTCDNSALLLPVVTGNNRTCNKRDGFHFNTTSFSCNPLCAEWTPYSKLELHITNVVVIIAGGVAIVSGIVVLILSCVRCKQIFSYPSVFVVYQTVPTIIMGGLVLVAFVGQPKLFCTDSDTTVLSSIGHPTTFCIATGVLLYYILMQLTLLWLFHVIAIFWGVYWPIEASLMQGSRKKIVLHIFAVSIAFVMPAVPVILIHYLSPGFTVTRFPPILCAAMDLKLNFYTFMLPISIIIASGLTLLVLTFWKLLKKRIIRKVHQTRISTDWCSNARVLIIFCYFVIFGIVVLSTFTVAMINFPLFIQKMDAYFECEGKGIDPGQIDCQDSRQAVESLVNPITTTIAFIILGFYPAVNLVYVIHCKELYERCCCCVPAREVHYTPNPSRPYSSINSTSTIRLDTHGLY